MAAKTTIQALRPNEVQLPSEWAWQVWLQGRHRGAEVSELPAGSGQGCSKTLMGVLRLMHRKQAAQRGAQVPAIQPAPTKCRSTQSEPAHICQCRQPHLHTYFMDFPAVTQYTMSRPIMTIHWQGITVQYPACLPRANWPCRDNTQCRR